MKWPEEFHKTYGDTISKTAKKYNLEPELLAGLIWQESRGNPKAKSPCGAYGLTQVMPATAKELNADLSTIEGQIEAGAKYLKWLKDNYAKGKIENMVAAYNAGPGRLKNDAWKQIKETREYVPRVLRYTIEYFNFVNRRNNGNL